MVRLSPRSSRLERSELLASRNRLDVHGKGNAVALSYSRDERDLGMRFLLDV